MARYKASRLRLKDRTYIQDSSGNVRQIKDGMKALIISLLLWTLFLGAALALRG
jgi:hypothetical protein